MRGGDVRFEVAGAHANCVDRAALLVQGHFNGDRDAAVGQGAWREITEAADQPRDGDGIVAIVTVLPLGAGRGGLPIPAARIKTGTGVSARFGASAGAAATSASISTAYMDITPRLRRNIGRVVPMIGRHPADGLHLIRHAGAGPVSEIRDRRRSHRP